MSASNGSSNGVVRIERKGKKKFAFGDDGAPFEVDVVAAFQEWIGIDEQFRIEEGAPGEGTVPTERMADYHQAAVDFATRCAGMPQADVNTDITRGEAMDFIARLRECYDDVAYFFRPKSREERGLLGTSAAASSAASTELRFSTEAP